MKTLKQIQEENRKFIIMANNPTAKTYEEALEMELGYGCIASVNGNDPQPIISKGFDYDKQEELFGFTYATSIESTFDDGISFFPNCSDLKIIGKPLTLDRVLISIIKHYAPTTIHYFLFSWDLKKKTLEEQIEETQRDFYELINEI